MECEGLLEVSTLRLFMTLSLKEANCRQAASLTRTFGLSNGTGLSLVLLYLVRSLIRIKGN